jgi:dihydroorotate dehydrogenase
MYKLIIKPLLFLFNPERAHHITFTLVNLICKIPFAKLFIKDLFTVGSKKLERTVFGIKFPNPVGLAAGFDKDAKLYNELACFGFGFIEVGTVTPKPQAGNDQPRLFRLPADEALINRMGFNNQGVEAMVQRLRSEQPDVIIGGNIGKNKVTPNEQSVNDYELCFNALFNYVDYFVVNVSSPNTPNLRELQEKEPLKALLGHLQNLNNSKPKPKPILLKIAPDLTNEQLDDVIEVVLETKLAGVVATNTTISRANLKTDTTAIGLGGLSGKPVTARSTEVIRYIATKSNNVFPIIGVGGIHSPQDAIDKLNAGASLIQLYTGFVYEGPALPKKICKKIVAI